MNLCHFSVVAKPFFIPFGIQACACDNFRCGCALTLNSKCRKWHLRGTYHKVERLKGADMLLLKTSLSLVDRVGNSDVGILCLAYYSIMTACLNLCFIIGGLY